ncbi:unnamed protein product, partial [Mesorhabditis spiculigera]
MSDSVFSSELSIWRGSNGVDSWSCSTIPPPSASDDFNCPICKAIFLQPVIFECGHSFCKHCVQRQRESNDKCCVCQKQFGRAIQNLALEKSFQRDNRSRKSFRRPSAKFDQHRPPSEVSGSVSLTELPPRTATRGVRWVKKMPRVAPRQQDYEADDSTDESLAPIPFTRATQRKSETCAKASVKRASFMRRSLNYMKKKGSDKFHVTDMPASGITDDLHKKKAPSLWKRIFTGNFTKSNK